jgi:two-component system NtrC family response regulator
MARILVVDDETRMAELLQRELQDNGHTVATVGAGARALDRLAEQEFDLVLSDLRMPGMDGLELLGRIKEQAPQTKVVLMTAYASAQTAVQAMKEGAFDYLIKPFEMDELMIMVDRIGERRRLELENAQLRSEIAGSEPVILGDSLPMRELMGLVAKVAKQGTTVLIQGESGTGKELVARAIHSNSTRSSGPMVTVNCAAIPETLIESELFGHERGAFTGADSRRLGRFELASDGTIFLDEVTELVPQAQAKLLRALQERVIERVGGGESIPVDVRVVAATNRDLQALVEEGEFRDDLFYRLNVFPIHMPALRDRKEDVPVLADYFLMRMGGSNRLSAEAVQILAGYNWPGNVRELENVVERAVILAGSGGEITPVHLADLATEAGRNGISQEGGRPVAAQEVTIPDEGVDLEELEKQHILEALRKAGGNKSEAARLLSISRRRLYSRMNHHNIEY